MLTLNEHRVDQAQWCPSPNFNLRPDPDDISLLVIHNISLPPEQFGGDHIQALFQNCLNPDDHPYFREIHQLTVSSHFLIRRDGSGAGIRQTSRQRASRRARDSHPGW